MELVNGAQAAGVALSLGFLPALPASGFELIANPSRDTSIFSENVDNSEGGNASLFVGRISDVFGGNVVTTRRGLIGFDISAIPAGATIQSVELQFTITRNSVRDAQTTDIFNMHQIQADWGEGTVDGGDLNGVGSAADPGDATWASNFSGSSSWATAGGDFDPTVSASITNLTIVTPGVTTADVTFSGPGLVADVQDWVDNPGSNYGWLLMADPSNGEKSARIFASRESNTPPVLTINYVPEPTSLVLLSFGGIALAARRRR